MREQRKGERERGDRRLNRKIKANLCSDEGKRTCENHKETSSHAV